MSLSREEYQFVVFISIKLNQIIWCFFFQSALTWSQKCTLNLAFQRIFFRSALCQTFDGNYLCNSLIGLAFTKAQKIMDGSKIVTCNPQIVLKIFRKRGNLTIN